MSEFLELAHDGIITQTGEAILFRFEENRVWISKSLIADYGDVFVEVERWFVEEEELEEYEL